MVDASGRGGYGGMSSRTPHHGTNTPAYHAGASTPAHGSQTPRADGSRTPSYGNDPSRTPQHDGSQTPRGGDNPWSAKSKYKINVPSVPILYIKELSLAWDWVKGSKSRILKTILLTFRHYFVGRLLVYWIKNRIRGL